MCARCLLSNAAPKAAGEAGAREDSFGDYVVLCEIGQGGMGIVYLAEQQGALRREVALKALKPGLDTTAILRRFETERATLAMMNHPAIATLYDAGASSRGRPYFVMELVDGEPITVACDRSRATIKERLALFSAVCRAIDHAHRKGVVHRDLKASNVLVTEHDGRRAPKVIDFGIARAMTSHLTGNTIETAFGELLGTPEYMSPEQASLDSRTVGPASDIYSLGVLLFELLTGALPFKPVDLRGASVPDALRTIREEPAPLLLSRLDGPDDAQIDEIARKRGTNANALRCALRGDLAHIPAKCLEKDPAQRYPSASALADDVDRYLRGEALVARRPVATTRALRILWRHRVFVAVAAATVIAASAAFWISRGVSRSILEVTPLTSYRGSESAPSFSPDAAEVAFAWNGEQENEWNIYRLRIGENTPKRLTSGPAAKYAPAWSPDGKSIAFLQASEQKTANLMLMPAGGGLARRIAEAHLNIEPRKRWLAWSRDGRWLLLAHRGPGAAHQRVFVISIDSGEQRQLTNSIGAPADADGQPSLSQDGRTLLFARDAETAGQIWMLPLTADLRPAGAERRIPIPGFDNKECAVPFAISSTAFLFFAPQRAIESVWRGVLSGREAPRQLAELGELPIAMDLSRDGHRMVYSRQNYDSNVWRIDLDRPAGKELARTRVLASTRRDENPALSPDGSTLAFESNRGGYPEIWIAAADGSNIQPLTDLRMEASSPLWSPDGREIAFHALRNGRTDVFVVPTRGGTPRQLTSDSIGAFQPVWSPDGQWIYFGSSRSGNREIWRMPAHGSEAVQVSHHGGFDLAFSPDGRWMFYSRERAPNTSIWRMPVAGGEESMVISSAIGGHVFATQRRLYFTEQAHESSSCAIRVLDLATREIKTLAVTDRLLRSRLGVSRDEKSIYFTQVDDDGMDLMLVADIR
jgi:Tol biopolymer transport system component/serine/threonine protein kinase